MQKSQLICCLERSLLSIGRCLQGLFIVTADGYLLGYRSVPGTECRYRSMNKLLAAPNDFQNVYRTLERVVNVGFHDSWVAEIAFRMLSMVPMP